jgi:glucose dehydrogenase
VLFGEDGKVVVGGSDHGSIYVFDRRTGEQLQALKHADGTVLTITVRRISMAQC